MCGLKLHSVEHSEPPHSRFSVRDEGFIILFPICFLEPDYQAYMYNMFLGKIIISDLLNDIQYQSEILQHTCEILP